MVLSLMSCALIAFAVARLISPALYPTLAKMQLGRIPSQPVASPQSETTD
jgi:hypothetical protein